MGTPARTASNEERARGNFGPKILRHVCDLERRYRNIRIVASTSGKLTKELVLFWVQNVLQPAVRQLPPPDAETEASRHALLLMDVWSGQQGEAVAEALQTAGTEVLTIPKLTISELQPLDVFFNRQYKRLWKRIRQAASDDSDAALAQLLSRDGILNVQSLMWDQFNSPRYENMLRYAWRKTDLFFDHGELDGDYIDKEGSLRSQFFCTNLLYICIQLTESKRISQVLSLNSKKSIFIFT